MIKILNQYLGLTKLFAVVMIVFVSGISYAISPELDFNWLRLFHIIVGIGIAGSGALALNQYLERHTDQLMDRTKERPLPKGNISPESAHLYGHFLMWGGYLYLAYTVNGLCAIATFVCGMSYLYIYTPMKTTSSLSTFFGSIPGAMLPIMGWLGKYNNIYEFDSLEPSIIIVLLSLILFLWQIPHALIITIRYKSDYEKAGMKHLPIIYNDEAAYRHIYLNIVLLMAASLIPFLYSIFPYLSYAIIIIVLHLWIWKAFWNYHKTKEPALLIRFYRRLMIYLPTLLTIIIVYNELSKISFHLENWF